MLLLQYTEISTLLQGLTFPVKEFYLEDILEKTHYTIQSDTDNFAGSSRRGRRQQESKKDPLMELYGVLLASHLDFFLFSVICSY